MILVMMASFKRTCDMELELRFLKMAVGTRENGKMINRMELDNFLTQKGKDLSQNGTKDPLLSGLQKNEPLKYLNFNQILFHNIYLA